jgi:uncharacterized protein (DUF1501 family)
MSQKPIQSPASRRAFLQHVARFSTLGAAGPMALGLSALSKASAATAATDDYKALVCIFMYGGNDAFNTVLATDTDSWTHYTNHRNPKSRNPSDTSTSIALLPAGTLATAGATRGSPEFFGGVLNIPHSQRATANTLALHPALGQALRLYNDRRLAVVSNIGPLVRPLDKTQYGDARFEKPAKLFSHNDQQSMWQSFEPEGAPYGWGGRMGDLLMSSNGQGLSAADQVLVQRSFTCITPTSAAIWLTGKTDTSNPPRLSTLQLQTSASGLIGLGNGSGSSSNIYGNTGLHAAVASVMTPQSPTNLLAQAQKEMVDRALRAHALLGSKLPSFALAPWGTVGVNAPNNDALLKYTSPIDGNQRFNNLALQLQMVARLIHANQAGGLNLKRQVFMVSMGGFDTHDNQNQEHGDRMAQLDHALSYFDDVLGNMPGGVDRRSQVTTFTGSDFGRTFTNNGDGTDHGWGGHHFVMGGAVKGGDVFGKFPLYSTATDKGVFGSPDQLGNGSLLPSTSVDQLAFTLGRWLGVSDTDLRGILPNLAQFNSSEQDLGLMA